MVHANGSFEVAFDAESASLFFIDRERQRSGFADRVQGDANVVVTMEPTATYSGTLVDDNAHPVAGDTLEMCVKTSEFYTSEVAAQQTDEAGRFRFTGVPSKVPIEFRNRRENDGPDRYVDKGDRMFNPGEVRENDLLKLRYRVGSSSPNASSAIPLAMSVEKTCRNVRSSGMRALVVLQGDDSGNTARTIDQLLDYDDERMKAVLSYLTLRVDPAQLKSEAAILAGYGWPTPAPGEIVLVVLDGDQKMIAVERVETNNVATAVGFGVDFLQAE